MATETTRKNRDAAPRAKKIDDLHDLIEDMDTALLTTRRPDGHLVTRPMAVQERAEVADLWFVTDRDSHKIDELETDPHVNVGFYDPESREWVSVSGTARTTQDRARIHELYQPDWKIWFGDQGGDKDGGPDDPRLMLILVDAHEVVYMKSDAKPKVMFEVAKAFVTGGTPEMGDVRHLSPEELDGKG